MTAITCQPKREVKFYGPLAKKLKRRSFKAIGLNSASEVMRCLLSNFPELESYMRGRYYRVVMNGRAISKDELDHQVKSLNEIHIIPAICGAGGGPLTSILTGVALIGAGILFPFAAPFLTPLGIGLVLQGVAELISPTPRDRPESTDPSARSYNFSGLQQTTREGVPVPLVYGEIMTGSIVISSKVEEDDDGGGGGLFNSGTGNPSPDQTPVPGPVVEPPCLGPDGQYLPEGMPCPPSYIYPSPGLEDGSEDGYPDLTKVPFYFWTFKTWLNLGGNGGTISCYDGSEIGGPTAGFNGMGYYVFEDVIACAVRISCEVQYQYRTCSVSLGGNGYSPTEGWPLTYLLRLDKWDLATGTWVFGDASNKVLFDRSYLDPPQGGNSLINSDAKSGTSGGNFRAIGPWRSYFPKNTVLISRERLNFRDRFLQPGDTPPPVGPAPEEANGVEGLNEYSP